MSVNQAPTDTHCRVQSVIPASIYDNGIGLKRVNVEREISIFWSFISYSFIFQCFSHIPAPFTVESERAIVKICAGHSQWHHIPVIISEICHFIRVDGRLLATGMTSGHGVILP